MEKLILQKKKHNTDGTMEWDTKGIFDNINDVVRWLTEYYGDEFDNSITYEELIDDYLEDSECRLIVTKMIKY